MADQQHTEVGEQSPVRLRGENDRARWLSVREYPEFCALAPDDSMAPAIRLGDRLTFDTRLTPREGDYALFVDGGGRAYVREYRGKKGGGFRAVPTNGKYQSTFHAKRDRLVVLAVLAANTFGSRGVQ